MREEELRSYYIYETKLTDDGLIVYLIPSGCMNGCHRTTAVTMNAPEQIL